MLLFLIAALPVSAQDASSNLDALLDRISFNNAEQPATLGKDLAELDGADLAKLSDMLVEPGAGDDTKPRMALHALTWYLGSSGSSEQRDKYIDVLCAALDSGKPPQVKAFFIRQLQLIGTDRAVATLAKFLQDDLYVDATQALLAIGSEKAAKALREVLPDTRGQRRIALIDALGVLRNWRTVPLLNLDAASEEKSVRLAAVSALGRTGDKSSVETVEASLSSGSRYDRSRAYDSLLNLAARLADRGAAATLYQQALAAPEEESDTHLRCAALYGLARLWGAEAIEEVVAGLMSADPEYRAAAFHAGVQLSGGTVTEAIVEALQKAADPNARVAILKVLTQRGDAGALPKSVDVLKDENPEVRLAAVEAVAVLGKENAVNPLVAFLDTENAEERKAAADALTGLKGEDVPERIAGAIADQPAVVRATLLNVLTRRRARTQLDTIYRFTGDQNEDVRIAAIKGIGRLANETAAPRLLRLLEKAGSDAEREEIELALASTCGRAESPAMRAAPLIDALDPDDVQNYCSLLRVLGRVGGPRALSQLRQAVGDARTDVQETAIRSFLEWPDASAAETVLQVARDVENLKHHVLAMRAYTRLVGLDAERPPKKTLKMYTAGLDATRRPDERRTLLSKLADVKHEQTLRFLHDYMSRHDELRSEAAAAMLSVAEKLLPDGWEGAGDAADAVLEFEVSDEIQARAEELLRRVAEFEDYITDWLVAGPFSQPGKKGTDLFDVPFPPEQPAAVANVKWKKQHVYQQPERYWHIDLTRSCGGSHPVGYLRTYVHSPTMQEVLLELGSDDGIKVWLNGEVIHANNALRGVGRAQDKVTATLKEGWNELLLKITNNGGGWGACVRVRSPDGDHLDGLKIDARQQP